MGDSMGSFTADIATVQSSETPAREWEAAFERILERFWSRCPSVRLPDNLQRVADDEDIRQEVAILMWTAMRATSAPVGKGIWNALASAGQGEVSKVFCRFFAAAIKNRSASRTRAVIREARHVRGASAVVTPEVPKDPIEAFGEVAGREVLPDLVVANAEEKERLANALLALPEEKQNIITSRYILGLSIEETAESLAITVAQVRYKTTLALDALKVALNVEGR